MTGSFPILMFCPPNLTDAVMASGLLARLKAEVPKAAFTLAGLPEVLPLFRDLHPEVRLLPVSPDPLGLHWLRAWASVSSVRWGLILDAWGTPLLPWLRAVKRARYTDLIPGFNEVGQLIEHQVVNYARLLKLEADPPSPALSVSEETRAEARALLGGQGPILAVAPGADWSGRQWPAERFAALAAHFLRADGPMAGGRLLILGDELHRDAAQSVRLATLRSQTIDLTARVDPLLAYACLQQARMFVGCDNLWLHLAAAAGIPALGVFGPSDEAISGPWGAQAKIVRGPRTFQDYLAADPGLNQAVGHMMDIRLETVAEAALALFEQTETNGGDFPDL